MTNTHRAHASTVLGQTHSTLQLYWTSLTDLASVIQHSPETPKHLHRHNRLRPDESISSSGPGRSSSASTPRHIGANDMSDRSKSTSLPSIMTPISPTGTGDAKSDEPNEPKARKACINCRKQKMRCRIDNGKTCRRCYRSGVPCVFVPRSNAAGLLTSPVSGGEIVTGDLSRDVLHRLQVIEEHLGFSSTANIDSTRDNDESGFLDEDEEFQDPQTPNVLWQAIKCLRASCPGSVNPDIWQQKTIKYLWQTFHDRMPGLHFLRSRQKFSSPYPLLLASILYCSSMRGDPDVAILSPHYFTVLTNAIAQLSIPNSPLGTPPPSTDLREEWAFQTVLGLVIAGLLTEASTRETGIWISIAYRLILEHCPPHVDEGSREWRRLFSGVQIVDLEHASLHMSCPVIPIEAPLPTLQISHRDQLYRLSRMMHTGLTHFTGRGLPTIWSCFNSDAAPRWGTGIGSTFTTVDGAVIRDWARQLDEWLVEFSNDSRDSEQDRTLVFRQYILHRLTVLSIYHPARGCNLYASGVTPKEQYELLLSARATLKLHINDNSIWSNWDLVMITWAALIVLQGIEGGAAEADDLRDINVHLNWLRQTNEPKPSLRDKLITRLEQGLAGVHTPSPNAFANSISLDTTLDGASSLDYSWHIFDQASLEQLAYPTWPDATQLPTSIQ